MTCSFQVFVVLALLNGLEAKVNEGDVSFHLLTKDKPNYPVQIFQKNLNDNFPRDGETVFLIHGWTQNRSSHWYEDLKNAYFSRQDKKYNVIEVDWSAPAAQNYLFAVRDTRTVGEMIANFVGDLVNDGVPLGGIHLCGHSLGAHVAGFAGKHFFEKFSKKIPRITALDPAGPFFQGFFVSPRDRLSKFDAHVVFVIHTDRNGFGYLTPCGTIDVFPNGGGANQPGCPDPERGETLFCSHHKSYEYYTDAVENPNSLIATECYSYSAFDVGLCQDHKKIDIAGDFSRKDDGNYYLHTSPIKPYGYKSNK